MLSVRTLCPALAAAVFWCCAAGMAFAAERTERDTEFVQTRPFRGLVRRAMAERASRAAAENDALRHAMLLLAREPDLLFVSTDNAGSPIPLLEGLARMLYSIRVENAGMTGFPPHVQAEVRVRLLPPADMRAAIRRALLRQDLQELYARAVVMQISLVEEYDNATPPALAMTPETGGEAEEQLRIRHILNRLDALEGYTELLPSLENSWKEPEAAHKQLAPLLERAPDNPLIRAAMAEALLQLNRPAEAMEHIGEALRLAPDFARAHNIGGAILLRQRLPALAADAFTRAIALAPRNPQYLAHRAAAYLVQEQLPEMCADFRSACALGDCDGYRWAKEKGQCP